MGRKFGNLQRLKGVTYYSLSPNELKPFAGIFFPGLKNWIRRYSRHIFPMGIPILIYSIIMTSVISEYEKSQHKNPDMYKDDV